MRMIRGVPLRMTTGRTRVAADGSRSAARCDRFSISRTLHYDSLSNFDENELGSFVPLLWRRMRIAIVGTGYVGLVAGACLAETGSDVVCVDTDDTKVRTLRRGKMPIYEPGLEELVRRNRQEGRLAFTTTLPKAVRASVVIFIVVGTPPGEDGAADVQYVLEVARDVARAMNGYKVVVNKSTVQSAPVSGCAR